MIIRICLFLMDMVFINVAFLTAFFIRYGGNIPELSFQPYKSNFAFLTIVFMFSLGFFKLYQKRFRSFWDIFKNSFLALSVGTLLCFAMVYVFRIKWSTFPSSVFLISFPISIACIFGMRSLVLGVAGSVRKKVVFIGKGKFNDIIADSRYIEKKQVENIQQLTECKDVDEIIICKKMHDEENFNLLIYLLQKLNTDILFLPSIYAELLSENFNGTSTSHFLATFFGKKTEAEEFLIRAFDIILSVFALIILSPLLLLVAVMVKLTSKGPVLYTQKRAGKDGKVFTMYKFRTMFNDAEKKSGLKPAIEGDERITKVGNVLRKTRIDELPQMINIIKGEMSLVGPRPENLYRVETHKALQGLRLAVKPGLTGLAQVRSLYDLHPKYKIRYDYLYIQKRSLLLNLYILTETIPVVFFKKGW